MVLSCNSSLKPTHWKLKPALSRLWDKEAKGTRESTSFWRLGKMPSTGRWHQQIGFEFWHVYTHLRSSSILRDPSMHAWDLQVFNLLYHCTPSISFLEPLCKWTCTTANCFDAVWVEHTGLPPCPNGDLFLTIWKEMTCLPHKQGPYQEILFCCLETGCSCNE